MEFLRKYLKGLAIGFAFIIPGVSGGTIAVLLNVYDTLVESVSNIRTNFKKSFAFLFPIGLGAISSVAALFIPIALMLDYAPLLLIFLFTGLIIGGIPPLFDKIKDKKWSSPNVGTLSATLLIAVALGVVPVIWNSDYVVDLSSIQFGGFVILFIIGVLAATALTIPGISGSMILLVFGYYQPILSLMKDFVKEILHLDFSNFGHCLLVFGVLGLGIIVGFVLTSKIMTILLKKHPTITYFGIIGFVFGSIFSLCYNTDTIKYYGEAIWWHYVVGAVLFIIGIFAASYLIKIGKKIADKEKANNKLTDEVQDI